MMNDNHKKFTTNMVFGNDGIAITIPLTGQCMPTEFKNVIRNDVSAQLSTVLTDDFFINGYTYVNHSIRTHRIELTMTVNSDGIFKDEFVLTFYIMPHKMREHRFDTRNISRTYTNLYRKKALKILKRMSKKGLKNIKNEVA